MSVVLNFFLNRNRVFRARGNHWRQAFFYTLLAIFLLAASYGGIRFSDKVWHWPPLLGKLAIESALFVFSFAVQRGIFRH